MILFCFLSALSFKSRKACPGSFFQPAGFGMRLWQLVKSPRKIRLHHALQKAVFQDRNSEIHRQKKGLKPRKPQNSARKTSLKSKHQIWQTEMRYGLWAPDWSGSGTACPKVIFCLPAAHSMYWQRHGAVQDGSRSVQPAKKWHNN